MPTQCKLCPEPKWFATKRGRNVHAAFMHREIASTPAPAKRKYKTARKPKFIGIAAEQSVPTGVFAAKKGSREVYVLVPLSTAIEVGLF